MWNVGCWLCRRQSLFQCVVLHIHAGSNKLFSSIFKKLSCFSPFPGLPPFILSYYLLLLCSVGIKLNTEKSKLRVEPSCFWVAMLMLICCLIPSNTVHCPCRINIWFKILPTIISQVVRFKWHRHCRVPFYSPSLIFRNFKNWSVFSLKDPRYSKSLCEKFLQHFFFLIQGNGWVQQGYFFRYRGNNNCFKCILYSVWHLSYVELPWMIYWSCNSDTGIVIHKTLPGRAHIGTCAKPPGELAAYLKNGVKMYIFV